MVDIVLDLETLGTRPGCTIIEIGACVVDATTGKITANFSRRVPNGYSFRELALGFVDSEDDDMRDTVSWWMGHQDRRETIRKILSRSVCQHTHAALYEFCDWMVARNDEADGNIRVWSNGPAFDIAILCASFDRYGIKRPWICWQERCVRTALEQAGYEKGSVPWAENGPKHRALNDARHEARKLFLSGALGETSAILKRLRQGAAPKAEGGAA